MRLRTGDKNITYLGADVVEKYGEMEFQSKTSLLLSIQLPRRMTNEEIVKELEPKEVELGEIYALLDSLPRETHALFHVKDKDFQIRKMFIFWYKDGWRIVSPTSEEVPFWNTKDLLFTKNI